MPINTASTRIDRLRKITVEMAETEYMVCGKGYLRGKDDVETLVDNSDKGTLVLIENAHKHLERLPETHSNADRAEAMLAACRGGDNGRPATDYVGHGYRVGLQASGPRDRPIFCRVLRDFGSHFSGGCGLDEPS